MADKDNFEPVSDGDCLQDGYYNKLLGFFGENIILNRIDNDVIGTPLTSGKNICYEFYTTDSAASNTGDYDSINGYQASLGIGYTFDNDLVDTVEWVKTGSGTLSNDTKRLRYLWNHGAGTGDVTNATNIFSNSNYIEFKIFTDSHSNNLTSKIYVTDGVRTSILKTINGIGNDTSIYRLFYDSANNQIDWWDDGAVQASIDITLWTSDIYIKTEHVATNAGNSSFYTYYIFETDSSWNYIYSGGIVTSNTLATITTSENSAILGIGTEYESAITGREVSFNNGVNYSTIPAQEIASINNIGTAVVVKITWDSGIFTYTDVNTNTIPCLNALGVIYK